MTEIESYHDSIEGSLNKLDALVNRNALYATNKKKWKDECNKLIQKIK
jgi:hypothetical protein